MELIYRLLARVNAGERGAAGVEYGMLVALIAVVIVGVVTLVGTQVHDAFNSLVGQF